MLRAEASAEPVYFPPLVARELLAVDESMRLFFSTQVDRDSPDGERLGEIVSAILRPDGLGFAYESGGTYDARETFRRRRGNCQGFSFLVLAVAREFGLKVRFQDIAAPQRWNRYDRFIASVRHTNVRMTSALEDCVVDLRPDLGRASFADDRHVVSDGRAFAHFYSTAGFFQLVKGDFKRALRLMNLATEMDPRSAIVWANLGNLHIHLGDLAAARQCFEKSLRLESRSEDALIGLVNVLRRQGGPAELKLAQKYERRAQVYRERSPYYAYHLAGMALLRGDTVEVEQRLRRAIRLKGDEPLFHEQLAALLRQLGRETEARQAEARLNKVRERLARVETSIMP